MTNTEFCYWLQGFFEISNADELNGTQTQIIKDHLNLVFKKVTPITIEGKKALLFPEKDTLYCDTNNNNLNRPLC